MKRKKKNKCETVTIILTAINAVLLILAIIAITQNKTIGIILTLLPLSISILMYMVLKKIKRHPTKDAIKKANITYLAVYLMLIILFLLIMQTPAQTQTLRINPAIEECITRCQELNEQVRECINNCLN